MMGCHWNNQQRGGMNVARCKVQLLLSLQTDLFSYNSMTQRFLFILYHS